MVRPNWICILAWSIGIGLTHSVFGFQVSSPADLSGFESSELYSIEDNLALTPSDQNLIRLLFRAGKTSQQSYFRFAKLNENVTVQQVTADTRKYRGNVFHLEGRAKRVGAVRVPTTENDGLIWGFNLVKFEDNEGIEFLVAVPGSFGGTKKSKTVNGLPSAWPAKVDIDQRADCFGVFLAVYDLRADPRLRQADREGQEDDVPTLGNVLDLRQVALPLFVARRIHWYPDRPNESMGITSDHVLLANQGVDVGQFDIVRANNNRKLSSGESSCFFQMLRATRELGPADMPKHAIGFQKLLQNPDAYFGNAVQLTGHVRRAVRIEITDPFIQQQFGLDHYYELDMFVPLHESKIVVKTPSRSGNNAADSEDEAAEQVIYEDRFPVTVCVAQLPCSEQEIEKKSFVIQGFYFKLWNYKSSFTDRQASQVGQPSPLIIALSPTIEESSSVPLDIILASGLLLVIAVGLTIAWFLFRSDQRSGEYLKRYKELPDSIKIDGDDETIRD